MDVGAFLVLDNDLPPQIELKVEVRMVDEYSNLGIMMMTHERGELVVKIEDCNTETKRYKMTHEKKISSKK